MQTSLRALHLACVTTLALGCNTPVAQLDGGADAPVDASADTIEVPDAYTRCVAPSVVVAGTPETDLIANAPPACGSTPHTWLRSETLGSVVSRRGGSRYTAAGLQGLADAASITLPSAPEHDVRAEFVVYETQDRGRRVESTAYVVYPTDMTGDVPVALLLHGTSGLRAGCGPTSEFETQVLAAVFASFGWVAVAPDFLGLESAGEPYGDLHPYLVGEATAIASLDAARAAIRTFGASTPGGACASNEVVLFGASQGGHALLWVDRLAPYYARELNLLGGVASVPSADLTAQMQRSVESTVPATTNFAAALAGQAHWYGQEAVLNSVLRAPFNTSVPEGLAMACNIANPTRDATVETLYTEAFRTQVTAEGVGAVDSVGCWFREASLTATSIPRITPASPSYGLLFIAGSEDDLIHPPIERAAYDALCASTPLAYLECEGAGHVDTTFWSVPEILGFMAARRSRTPFTRVCTRPAAQRCMGTP
jgi:dienelactone hydrolase